MVIYSSKMTLWILIKLWSDRWQNKDMQITMFFSLKNICKRFKSYIVIVSSMEQMLFTLPEYLNSSWFLSGVCHSSFRFQCSVVCLSFVSFCWSSLSSDLMSSVCPFGIFESLVVDIFLKIGTKHQLKWNLVMFFKNLLHLTVSMSTLNIHNKEIIRYDDYWRN